MSTTQRPGDSPASVDAYERLLAQIRSGALKPGERLTETELAKVLGLSRTPVREALRRMEIEGLISHAPRIGLSVRALDWSEISELYELRAVLESTAARMAARAASDVDLAELNAIHADMEQAVDDPAQFYLLNRHFHRALLDAARNRFLPRSLDALQKPLLILQPNVMREATRAKDALAEHAAILAALAARDGDAAEAAMRRHVETAHRLRLRQLRDAAG